MKELGLRLLTVITLSIPGLAHAERPEHPQAEATVMTDEGDWGEAEAALAVNTERLLRIPGVMGVGLGLSDDGRPAVHVYFNPGAAAGRGADAMIPQAIGDVPVKVIETDDFEAR